MTLAVDSSALALIRQFGKTVLIGAVAGALPPVAWATFTDNSMLFPLATFSLLITLPVVFGASLLIGIPATVMLERIDGEGMGSYTLVGGFVGFALPTIWLVSVGASFFAYWMPLCGAFSGATTGYMWWACSRSHIDR